MSGRMMSLEVQEKVKKLIVDQRLAPGAPLATESELMERLEVSRNALREALKALQAMRIVEIRHGFGTYVGGMSLEPMIEGLSFRTVVGHYQGEDSLLELLELREALETGLISRIVGNVPDKQLAELTEIVDRMGTEANDGAISPDIDRAFHLTLYQPLNNRMLSEVLDAFWDAFHRVRTDLVEPRTDPTTTWRQHQEILAAVRAGAARRAEDAVRQHFDGIRQRLGQGPHVSGPVDVDS